MLLVVDVACRLPPKSVVCCWLFCHLSTALGSYSLCERAAAALVLFLGLNICGRHRVSVFCRTVLSSTVAFSRVYGGRRVIFWSNCVARLEPFVRSTPILSLLLGPCPFVPSGPLLPLARARLGRVVSLVTLWPAHSAAHLVAL